MKRIFAAAALALVCILTACGTGSPAPEGGTTTPMVCRFPCRRA